MPLSSVMLKIEQLAELVEKHKTATQTRVKEFSLRGKQFRFNAQPAIMGVINLSSDSWYRESVCLSTDMAIQRAHVLAAQGADIIDVGAESTLGHAARQSARLQKARLR